MGSLSPRVDTAESLLADRREVDQLKHLVRKHPVEAMECLTFNQMLDYILSHKHAAIKLVEAVMVKNAEVKLAGVSADTL